MTTKGLTWDMEKGTILLSSGDGKKEKVIMMRQGFMNAFFQEIEKVEGKDTLKMTFRMLLKKLGASDDLVNNPKYESIEKFNDEIILPLSFDTKQLGEVYSWDGKTRTITGFGDTIFMLTPIRVLQKFKDVSVEILSERGARAIIRNVAWRAGKAIGDQVKDNYKWKDVEDALGSIDGVLMFVAPMMGWGRTRGFFEKGADGNLMFYLKYRNLFEADGIVSDRPNCYIIENYLRGIGESIITSMTGKIAESKEVKCASIGDDYCAFAIKQKDTGASPLDWDELKEECDALDAMESKSG
jgi:predicted hydrocarbon binding protein